MTIREAPPKGTAPVLRRGEPGQSGKKGTLVSPDGLPGRPVDPEGEGGDPWVQLPCVFCGVKHRSAAFHSDVPS
jgi:hypothetical protein